MPAPRSGSPLPPARSYPLGRPARMTVYLLLGVLGAAVGLAGALIVDLWSGGGLVLGTAGIIALSYGGSTVTGTRTGAVVPTATWLGVLLVASVSTPKGDLIWGGSATSLALLFLGLLGSVLSLARPSLSPFRHGPSGSVLPPASPRRDGSQ
ncbi:hypothetical protein DN069_15845 [Streptacidiphilus pinicola]|uniref:Integral membrane protein n=1 Tax=Streptacidiphilus pinicola TaxID=2219663 RepID=A0A2X0IM06_9ACTN|nr:hypothetical protein DN069_15845 [Streptacidiphilus pinicola]